MPDLAARSPALIEVEFFGVPRLLAGQRSLAATGRTLADLARDLAVRCPTLLGPVIDPATGWLLRGYTFVVDERFTTDPRTPVADAAAVLLVSSVAGG